jgi:aryl-alcohol dehydrogenase-like predicted oxidoreductase
MNQAEIPSQFEQWKSTFEKWHSYLKENNISALDASLAYPLSFPEIDKIIVGVENQQQLTQILRASNPIKNIDLPDLSSEDEHFINPANWLKL